MTYAEELIQEMGRRSRKEGLQEGHRKGLLERAFEQAESLAAMFESYDSTIPATTP